MHTPPASLPDPRWAQRAGSYLSVLRPRGSTSFDSAESFDREHYLWVSSALIALRYPKFRVSQKLTQISCANLIFVVVQASKHLRDVVCYISVAYEFLTEVLLWLSISFNRIRRIKKFINTSSNYKHISEFWCRLIIVAWYIDVINLTLVSVSRRVILGY